MACFSDVLSIPAGLSRTVQAVTLADYGGQRTGDKSYPQNVIKLFSQPPAEGGKRSRLNALFYAAVTGRRCYFAIIPTTIESRNALFFSHSSRGINADFSTAAGLARLCPGL